ncbi:hypothetical protein [Pyrobaculum aerophilum]|uniref:Uncharacterized protein n=1 Tax=Pyrobaculum aerophilum TaxID=13773 RepID=A0A371QVV6_9CREN|nr:MULTISPECIES: hypothetical protein [Pyrobaculum]RFA94304.1 hypothetical protein CGL51_10520 [Pyrobaculum aerophilum]RFA98408.1 hypothetical protein CGL52_07210 [Pyrobaculum aerophilum]
MPLLLYSYVKELNPEFMARLGAGTTGLGVYLYTISQIWYYACRISLRYASWGGAVFFLIFLSTYGRYVAVFPLLLALVIYIITPLQMGIKLGVFTGWPRAALWFILWNLIGAIIAFIPASLLGLERTPWMWYVEPPISPIKAAVLGLAGVLATVLLGFAWKSLNKC